MTAHPTRTGAIAVAAAGCAAALAACSSSGHTGPPPATTSAVATSAAGTSTVSTTAPSRPPSSVRSTTPPATSTRPPVPPASSPASASASASTSASTSAPSASQPAPSSPPPCPDGSLAVAAVREGALPGQELALLRFTNRSTATCAVTGFPGVELLLRGRPVGKPATRSTLRPTTVQLRPGASATAELHDATQCDAPLSDHVGVYPPNQTVQRRAALVLRACTLTIDPVRR
jgi:hypothetical protein